MSCSFKGRCILGGVLRAQAIVSKSEIDLEKCSKKTQNKKKFSLIVEDRKNELYLKNICGKVLCVRNISSSNSIELTLLAMAENKTLPCCILCVEELPNPVLAALAINKNIVKTDLVVVDKMGEGFLKVIDNGDIVSVCDESVIIE